MSPNEALLREQAAPRERVLDEHMFAVAYGPPLPATMRLQLFTAPDARPVMVAIQSSNEGPSLVNAAETYVGDAWRRLCPDEPRPPLWVQRQIFPDDHRANYGIDLVTFEKADATTHTVAGPEWGLIDDEILARLVGGPVDRGRGDGYVPRPPEPEPEPRLLVAPVVRLPRPRTCRAPDCMPAAGIPWTRRVVRQLRPRFAARDCCWYHGGSWHVVTCAAIDLRRRAQCEGTTASELLDRTRELAHDAELPAWEHEALLSLLVDPILPGRTGFINGSHRSQAMLDQGVRQVLVVEYVDPPDRAEAEAALAAWAAEHTPGHP